MEQNEILDAVELNDRYHAVLSDHCGNPVLKELLEDIRGQVRRLEVMDFRGVLEDVGGETHRIWVRQHEGVIDRVREGDYEAAQQLLYQNRSIAYLTSGNGAVAMDRAESAPIGGAAESERQYAGPGDADVPVHAGAAAPDPATGADHAAAVPVHDRR